MLRVRLERIPPLGGTPITLGIVEIVNDGSGTEETGNYDVVLRKVYAGRPVREGRVEGFRRERGRGVGFGDAGTAEAAEGRA